ncbi:matrix metallo ase-11 [Fusarium longipes]|uniref:Matrix metallo ase-11 n=1 Tax=Fusarium longipes TaxID=694270 RepID=A0A395T2F8_9HYPO|nr:matrix metallo ase-11 [Fusarium longipes]
MSRRYPCITQKGDEPSLAADPSSEPNIPSIVLGMDSIIPRWKTPTTLKWYLMADRFPSAEEAEIAARALNEAADEWHNVDFGVTILQTTNMHEANFNLVYRKNSRSDPDTLGRGFFPNIGDSDIIVFSYAMQPTERYRLKNVFLHELGHVFGLRHEFAIAEEGLGAKQFMMKNPLSVMDYNDQPMVQDSDRQGLRAFYKLAEGSDVDGSPVVDFIPRLRSVNQA